MFVGADSLISGPAKHVVNLDRQQKLVRRIEDHLVLEYRVKILSRCSSDGCVTEPVEVGKPIRKLNPKPLRNQFAVGQIKIRLAGRFVQVHCLKRLGTDRDPKRVCRANLRQNELGWKVAIASGCVCATRSRGNAGDRECEKTSDPPTMERISSAILEIARSRFHTYPPSF
jgi:hypothetical protein